MFLMSSYCNWCFCAYFAGKRTDGKQTLEAIPQLINITDQSLPSAGKFHAYYKSGQQRGILEKKVKWIQPVMSGTS